MLNFIYTSIVAVGLIISSFFGHQTPKQTFGDYNPAGAGTYRLQSSIGATDTSLTLSSFKEPVSSLPYTMAYLNSTIEYATLEPSNNTSKEFISFTGITQNADGTATITGLTRGLSFAFPYTASTTFQQSHSGQSIFILSNPPQLTNMYANKTNNETVTGLWNFTNAPIDNGVSTSSLQFATRAYVNSVAIQGAATSTFTTSGISTLATGAQAAAGTYSLAQPYLLSSAISTSTRVNSDNNKIIVTQNNSGFLNTIDPNFLPRNSDITWGGNITFSGVGNGNAITGTMLLGSTTLNATTTIAASSTTTAALVLNKLPYQFPTTQSASSTALLNDGKGDLIWGGVDWQLLATNTISDNTTCMATSTFSARQDLLIVFDAQGIQNGNGGYNLRFNGDSGSTNYGWKSHEGLSTLSESSASNAASIRLIGNGSTTTPATFYIHVNNNTTTRKTVTIDGSAYDTAGAVAPMRILTDAIWNNTSAQISALAFGTSNFPNTCANTQFVSGTKWRVYGSAN